MLSRRRYALIALIAAFALISSSRQLDPGRIPCRTAHAGIDEGHAGDNEEELQTLISDGDHGQAAAAAGCH